MSVHAAEHRFRVNRILHDARLNKRGRKVALWNYFLTQEIQAGTQFIVAKPGGQIYMVRGDSGEIIQLPRASRGGDRWFSYFTQVYGLSEREEQTQFIYDTLRSYISTSGTKVELRRFSAYNVTTKTGYISSYNGRMWRLDGSEIEEIACGEDGVFFADDDQGTHCAPTIGNHGILLDRLTNINFVDEGLSGITPTQQRMAMIIWIFALAFPDLMPTKPLLIVEGAPGSGKSLCLQLLQLALMGVSRPMILQRNKEDDFGVILLRSPIAVFDNTDAYIEWVPDAVCAYATNGSWTKRKLFTDDEQLVIKPHSFIAVASKNPASFRREDTADRCIILRLERRESFLRAESLQQKILDERSMILGEYMWTVGQIIEQLREMEGEQHEEIHRMADFATFGRAVGKVLHWEENAIAELMTAIQSERNSFINEEDPLSDLLDRWINYAQRNGPRNAGRIVSIYQLHTELEAFALAGGIPFKYTTRTLAQKIKSPSMSKIRVETIPVGDSKSYRLWRATDPKLEVVG